MKPQPGDTAEAKLYGGHKLNDNSRLELILEAVRYCQRVANLGMPKSAYIKALREPVYYLWECRHGGKSRAMFRSVMARGLQFGKRELVYDHAIPFRFLADELLQLSNVTTVAVLALLERYSTVVLITREEDAKLRAAGLTAKMPEGWDGIDPFARYKAVGVQFEKCENEK